MSDQHSEAPSFPAPPRPPFPGRTRATWFLVAASLLPGVLAAVAPELWHGCPTPSASPCTSCAVSWWRRSWRLSWPTRKALDSPEHGP